MHMADALLSPPVGAAMWTATAATTVWCAKRVRAELDPARVPLMGVTGAFVFAAQMLNFTIPGTGASGHLGGGLLLAILLGPEAAFLVMASVLTVQALFFADGGLLALGANIFNLGFIPAFIAYPLIYRPLVSGNASRRRVFVGSLLAAIVGLQLGSLCVVLETVLSGVSELPFSTFALLMLPIHLAIGVVEGLVTAAVIMFVSRVQPELLTTAPGRANRGRPARYVLIGFLVAALVLGGVLSWFASARPDGLEWAIEQVVGSAGIDGSDTAVHKGGQDIQERTAILPDYGFTGQSASESAEPSEPSAPGPNANSSVSGLVGAIVTLSLVALTGTFLSRKHRKRAAQ